MTEFDLLETNYWNWLKKTCPYSRVDSVRRAEWIRDTPFPFGGKIWRREGVRVFSGNSRHGGWQVTFTSDDATVVAEKSEPTSRWPRKARAA